MKKIDLALVDGEFENPLTKPIERPEQVAAIFNSIKDRAFETLLAIYLRGDGTGVYDVHSTGGISECLLSVYDLYGRAYVLRARTYILVHNHPNTGNAKPSRTDWKAIKRLGETESHEPTLEDFIIIGDKGDYWSWRNYVGDEDYRLGRT